VSLIKKNIINDKITLKIFVKKLWQKIYAKEQFCIIVKKPHINEMWEFDRFSNCTTNWKI